jgi:hypothetical protein
LIAADADPWRVVGQVEHVTSGTSARFEAIERPGLLLCEILIHSIALLASR